MKPHKLAQRATAQRAAAATYAQGTDARQRVAALSYAELPAPLAWRVAARVAGARGRVALAARRALRVSAVTAAVGATAFVAFGVGAVAGHANGVRDAHSAPVSVASTASASPYLLTVTADRGACQPDYFAGAWHICGVVYPIGAEDDARPGYDAALGAYTLTFVEH